MPDDLQWYDWFRIATAVMCAFVFWRESLRLLKVHHKFNARLRDLWYVYLLFMFVVFYGSLEAVVLDVDGGPRNFLVLFASAVAFRAALRSAPVDRVEDDHGAT